MTSRYIYLLAMGHFFCDIAMGALPAILPFFIAAYGMDYKDVGGLMFASSFLSSVIQPLFGWMADRQSKNYFMPLGILLAGVAMGITGLMTDYWFIFAAVMLSGVGSAVFHPEATCMVNKVAGEKRGTALSIFSVGGNAGFAVGPVIAIAAVGAFGLRGTSVLCFLAVLMAAMLMFFVPQMKDKIQRQVAGKYDGAVRGMAGRKNDWNAFSRLLLLVICTSIAVCGLRSFIPLYWVDVMQQSPTAAGSALTLLFAFGVITTLLGGLLADRFGYLKIVRVSYILLAISVALLSQTKSPLLGYLLLVPMGFAMFAPFSSVVVLGQMYLARSIGFASGVTMGLFFSVGGLIIPLIGSFADDQGLMLTMQLLAAFAALAAGAAFLLPAGTKSVTKTQAETI